jgi:uncharacterized protein (DUF1499 family)
MMLILKWSLAALLLVGLVVLIAGCVGAFGGRAPSGLDVREGRLKPPSSTPNSVTSQAALYPDHPQRAYATVEPFRPRSGEDGTRTMARIREVVERMPGAVVVTSRPDYLYAQFTTRLMRYVDDVEFWFDPQQQVVQVRSASRVGRSDLGLNRQRIESIRTALDRPV